MTRMQLSSFLKISIPILISVVAISSLFIASTNEQAEQEKFEQTFNSDYRVYALQHPSSLDLAGESVPLELIDVKEKFDLVCKGSTYQNIQKVYKSKRFTKSRQKYYEKGSFQDQFSKDELLVLKHNLSKQVTEDLGYLW